MLLTFPSETLSGDNRWMPLAVNAHTFLDYRKNLYRGAPTLEE